MLYMYGKCRSLLLLSWNIDGLDERDLEERTTAVCQTILLKQPHVVFLQEVIHQTLKILQQKLKTKYHFFVPSNPPVHYFVAVLVKKDASGGLVPGSHTSHSFPGSRMGRQLLEVPLSFRGVDYIFLTSHLESLKDSSAERKAQLKAAFEVMVKAGKEWKACVFGGDLNIRDAELKSVGIPEGIADAWQACGSDPESKFTWDVKNNDNLDWRYPNRPQARYDRVFFTTGGSGRLQPRLFELVGQDRLHNCGRFPSDHWGIWVEFET